MKHFYLFVFFLLTSTLSFGQQGNETDRIIVKLQHGATGFFQASENQKSSNRSKVDVVTQQFHALRITQQSTGIKSKQVFYVISFPAGTNIQEVIEAYYQTGEIDYAEPDYIGSSAGVKADVPNDTYYSRQWSLKNNGTFTATPSIPGADIDMENAWAIEQGSSTVVVGIIDTGAKLDHPEFNGRIWTNDHETAGNGIDDDNNGYVDDVKGWDFANTDKNPTDDNGHGTNVAGIVGSKGNNSMGYTGVDRNCKLMILKVLDNQGSGYYSWWTDAIYYAVDNGAKVLNMSLGGSSNSTTLQDAINYALTHNVVVVVCMMNTNSNALYYPAVLPGVIAVGSTNPTDYRTSPFFWSPSSGSNFGSHISVVAPGNYIYGLNHLTNNNFGTYWGGTSQATPHVAGLAALLFAQDNNRTNAQIKSIIESTAEDQVGNPTEDVLGWDQYYGYGRINAYRALSHTTGISTGNLNNTYFSVFPNPTHESFTVVFPMGAQHVQIFNSLGESIQSAAVQGKTSQQFHLSDNGVYSIQVSMEGEIRSQKIIVCR